jgi:PGF-CTERM protein
VTVVPSGADVAVTTEVTYRRDGDAVATKRVTVPPDGTTVTFEAEADASAGPTLTHAVAGPAGTSEATTAVREPGQVVVVDVTTATTPAPSGGVAVEATVRNDGGRPVTRTVELHLGDGIQDRAEVRLDPGRSTTVSLTAPVDSAGNYEVAVRTGDDRATPTVPVAEEVSGPADTETSGSAPGFGVVAALVALALLVVAGRWRR